MIFCFLTLQKETDDNLTLLFVLFFPGQTARYSTRYKNGGIAKYFAIPPKQIHRYAAPRFSSLLLLLAHQYIDQRTNES